MKTITLCGSSKFKKEFEEVSKDLTLKRNVVMGLEFYGKSDGLLFTNDDIRVLEMIHRKKIDMSDEIFVINPDGYIGETTEKDIEYAIKKKKKVTYLENPKYSQLKLGDLI